MVENFGGTLNLILFLINLLGISYYGFLTIFSPNSLVTRYDLGEKALPIVRIIGTFILPIVIIALLIREPGGFAALWGTTKQKLRMWPYPH